jgi:hypothetical protein
MNTTIRLRSTAHTSEWKGFHIGVARRGKLHVLRIEQISAFVDLGSRIESVQSGGIQGFESHCIIVSAVSALNAYH